MEALARPDDDKCRAALVMELRAMQANQVYEIRELLAGASTVGCTMLLYIKQARVTYK